MRKRKLRTYQVTLTECRHLNCYLDAMDREEALKTTLTTWRLANADRAQQLPFEVISAELAQPPTARQVTRA
jgi:hypothetical protein